MSDIQLGPPGSITTAMPDGVERFMKPTQWNGLVEDFHNISKSATFLGILSAFPTFGLTCLCFPCVTRMIMRNDLVLTVSRVNKQYFFSKTIVFLNSDCTISIKKLALDNLEAPRIDGASLGSAKDQPQVVYVQQQPQILYVQPPQGVMMYGQPQGQMTMGGQIPQGQMVYGGQMQTQHTAPHAVAPAPVMASNVSM